MSRRLIAEAAPAAAPRATVRPARDACPSCSTLAPARASALAAAPDLAHHGLLLFPVHGAGCDLVGRALVKRWASGASTDPERIRAWWRCWPGAAVALPTGRRAGLVVLRVRGEMGRAALRKFQHEHGALPSTPTLERADGRDRLLFFRAPSRRLVGRTLAAGVRLIGDGEYFVMPVVGP